MLPPSTPSPLHRIKVCSTAEFRAPSSSSSSLLGRIPYPSFLFISLYGLISSFPRRARYIYRFVSPSGSCLYHTATSASPLAVRPPKLSRRHDLCFLRPSGGLIPFCCRMYIYVCAAASPVPFSVLSLRRCLPRAALARARAQISRTRPTIPARHAVDGESSLSPRFAASFETSFQRFRHPRSPPPAPVLFL